MCKVSVIIPNYNHSNFLTERIDSVIQQTYQDFEVIILDDCSTDNSREIIEAYRTHPKVSNIIYNEINSGSTFKQWNKGVELSSGEIIWIAESDDVADTKFLETLASKFDLNPNLGIAYCQSYRMTDKGVVTGTWLDHTSRFTDNKFDLDFEMQGAEYIEKYLIYLNTIPNASATLFKKEVYTGIGGTDVNIKYCSDWLTWIKILLNSDVAYVATPLNFFRYHKKSVIASAVLKFNNETHHEKYDKVLRKKLNLELQLTKLDRNKIVQQKNKKLLNQIIADEGLFHFLNKRRLKGMHFIIIASIKGKTIIPIISVLKYTKNKLSSKIR